MTASGKRLFKKQKRLVTRKVRKVEITEGVYHLIEDDRLEQVPEFCRVDWFVRSRLHLNQIMKIKCQPKNYQTWAVVVVKWSACSPSTQTIRVRILLTPSVFSVKFVFRKNENKQKRCRGRPIFKY